MAEAYSRFLAFIRLKMEFLLVEIMKITTKRRIWKYRGRRVLSGDLFYVHVHADELSYSLNYDTLTSYLFIRIYLVINKVWTRFRTSRRCKHENDVPEAKINGHWNTFHSHRSPIAAFGQIFFLIGEITLILVRVYLYLHAQYVSYE